MRNFFITTLILFIPIVAWSQEKIDLEIIHKIKQEGLNNSKVDELAFYLTDYAGPRLTNSPNYRRAGDWAVEQLTTYGLENAKKEVWGEFGRGWEVNKSYIAMTEPYYMPFICIPKAWTKGLDAPVSGEVILLDIQTEEDLENYQGKLKDKVVLIKSSSDASPSFKPDASRLTVEELEKKSKQSIGSRSRYTPQELAQYRVRRNLRQKINELLASEGIKMVIGGSRGKHGTFFSSGGRGYKADSESIYTEVDMAPEHADLLARLIENGIAVKIDAEIKTTFHEDDLSSFNVIADIPGVDKKIGKELVMLGGHLDSWHAATGAADNAAGCIVMMEAVRILKAIGYNPRRTIRIGLWAGEEQGLYGSRNYVKNHFVDPATMELKPDFNNFSAYYNIDNGTGRIRGIYLEGNDMLRPIFEEWFKPLDDLIDNRTISLQSTGGTDHRAFDAVGLPGFQFIQDPIEYFSRTWHTNMDLRERLITEDLQQMAIIVASFVYLTADRDEKLPRKPLPEASIN